MGTRKTTLSGRLDPERRLLLALVHRAATDWKRAEALGVRPGHMPSRLTRRIGLNCEPHDILTLVPFFHSPVLAQILLLANLPLPDAETLRRRLHIPDMGGFHS